MRVFIHTSSWAVWAARFARPVVPLVLLTLVLHYVGYLSSEVFVTTIGVALGLSLISMACAIIGYVRMWYNGDAGWRTAAFGMILGLVSLGVLGLFLYLDGVHPRTSDVTTASFDIPLAPNRVGQVSTPSQIDDEQYKGATSRQYQTSIQTFEEALNFAVAQLGWKSNGTQRLGASETLNFYVAKTLLGFKDDITVYTRETQNSVVVEVRSSSRYGQSDLGTNAKRIAAFLFIIDERISTARGIIPNEES